jgi:hypothetical protein
LDIDLQNNGAAEYISTDKVGIEINYGENTLEIRIFNK